MAKRYHDSKRDPRPMAREYEESGYQTRHMLPNDKGRGAVLREDMSRPCGLPMGAIQHDVDSEARMAYNNRGVNDLFELVNQTLKEDSRDVRSMTKPRNF